jgi:hypothetical protein
MHVHQGNKRKTGKVVALNCLSHPSSVLCIIILLVNDFVIKALWPSWISGKLSDFAGLYFFPFLLAFFLAIALNRLSIQRRTIGLIAMGMTGVCFGLIKTIPLINEWSTDFLESFLGIPAEIVLDPTDLTALIMLLPSWSLWNRADPSRSPRYALLVVALGSLASLATSGPTYITLTGLAQVDGMLYAGGEGMIIRSSDGGMTWEEVEVPENVVRDDEKAQGNVVNEVLLTPKFPIVRCSLDDPALCYRLIGSEMVERSDDGGQNWEIDWETPRGRRLFMERYSTWKDVDLGPYDLEIIGSGPKQSVVVAAGNEGLLISSMDGVWERVDTPSTEPTPYMESDLGAIFFIILLPEALLISITGYIALNGFSWSSWSYAIRQMDIGFQGKVPASWIRRPFLTSVVILLIAILILPILLIVDLTIGKASPGSYAINYLPYAVLILPVGIGLSWRRLSKVVEQRERVWKAAGWILFAALLIFPGAFSPFVFWSYGIITHYMIAAFISLIIVLVAVSLGLRGRKSLGSISIDEKNV